jgi:phosphonate C-P lyase system protein PhnG
MKTDIQLTKEIVFESLMQGDPELIRACAENLRPQIDHQVIQAPAQELIMFRAEESVEKIDFNVGEVLVTTAKVQVKDIIGYSMVMDVDNQKALDNAFLMGVFESGVEQSQTVEALARELKHKFEADLRNDREMVSATRVNFEVMGGQDPNIKHNLSED